MARPSRAERRRMTARDAAVASPKRTSPVVVADTSVADSTPVITEQPRAVRTTRRVTRTPEQVDYTAEYTIIAHDLRRIAVWGVLLIALMIGVRYSGLV